MSPPPAQSPATATAPRGRRWHVRLAFVRAVMGIFPPFTLNRTRLLALKACGLAIGPSTLFWGLPVLKGQGAITSRLAIGSYCGLNEGIEFDLTAPISIGDHVSVGHEVRFLTRSSAAGAETAAPITIGDGAWLGARCTIMGGVTIGAGSVIGAGKTITEDVEPNMLVNGGKPVSLARWG